MSKPTNSNRVDIERERCLTALDASTACGIDDAEAGPVEEIERVREQARRRFAGEASDGPP